MAAHGPMSGSIRPRPPGGLLRPAVILLAVLGLLLWLPAAPAGAHAQLLRSTPADGSVVVAAPDSVELLFNEDINPAFAQIIVRDATGATVATPEPKVEGPTVRVGLPELQPGRVTVLFRVVSKDSHPIPGQVSFTIDGGPGFVAPSANDSAGAANDGSGAGGNDQRAAGTGTDAGWASSASGPPAAWLYVVTGLVALVLMTLGAIVLRRERHSAAGDVASPARSG